MLLVGLFPMSAHAVPRSELETAIAETAEFLLRAVPNPEISPVGGEWLVLGLARSGHPVSDAFFDTYRSAVERQLAAGGGVLDERRITEYSRVTLALTAAGFDPRDVGGVDLTAPLGDFDRTVWQGINGPIFALLALDSQAFPVPISANAEAQATRVRYVAEILRRQTTDGGWNLTAGIHGPVGADERGDADITGMALQALARYRHLPEVNAAIERALLLLSQTQDADGGFSSGFSAGSSNVESAVQVLVALGELGIAVDDPRFVKNGNTLLDNILRFRNPDGGFRRALDQPETNLMSTEQAFYGMVAAQRGMEGQNSLYRMSDATRRGALAPEIGVGLPGRHVDVRSVAVRFPGRTFPDVAVHPSRPAIEALAARGIINGRNATTFAPDETMTRAEFAAITTRALGLPNRAAADFGFGDVPPGAWHALPVQTAFYYGIVLGTSATTFHPSGTITRQEAAVMITRAAGLAGMNTTLSETEIASILAQFGDEQAVAGWARGALAFVYHTGILDDAESDIQPTVAIRRGEIAEMLYRLLDQAILL